jgi:hypothetical protein
MGFDLTYSLHRQIDAGGDLFVVGGSDHATLYEAKHLIREGEILQGENLEEMCVWRPEPAAFDCSE